MRSVTFGNDPARFLILSGCLDGVQNAAVGIADRYGAAGPLRQELRQGKRLFFVIKIQGNHRESRRASSQNNFRGGHRGCRRPGELIHSSK